MSASRPLFNLSAHMDPQLKTAATRRVLRASGLQRETAPKMPRGIFLTLLFLALPGVLWQAFEMYGLTLGGSQVLFFSIAHTMPLVALLVMAAVPLGLVVLVWATFSLLLPTMRNRLDMERITLIPIVVYLTVHGVFLAAYDVWSNTIMRVPVCILGIVSVGGCILLVVGQGFRRGNHVRPV